MNTPVSTPKPSAAALRAAKALYPYGIGSYCYSTPEQNDAAKQRDWEAKAAVIERETGLSDLLNFVGELDNRIRAMPGNPPIGRRSRRKSSGTLVR